MAFPQLPSYISGQSQENNMNNNQQIGLDSITLGQLKAMQSYYDFQYDDEDTVLNEIEEFYSYVEMPQVAENLKAWEGSFPGEWIKSSFAQRKAHVEVLLESLEHRDAEIRFTNARRLLYVLQGTFAETTSREHQLLWIFENCKVVRAADGLSNMWKQLRSPAPNMTSCGNLSDADAAHFNISLTEKADFMEEVTTELSVYLGMLYHMVEVFKGHDDFADELMNKSAKGYPVKKLLLVLWKTILSCCGGIRELARVKKLSRELAGLAAFQRKPKKQQFQTDQNRPFLFPFSRSRVGYKDARLVPFAIDEADKLYARHMYVSLSLWQMWKTREECMTAESGLDFMPGSEKIIEPKLIQSSSQDDETSDRLPDVILIDLKLAEAQKALANAEAGTSEYRKAKERAEDLMRLKRVEQIYCCITCLVRLGTSVAEIAFGDRLCCYWRCSPISDSTGFPPGVPSPLDPPPPPPPTLDEIDVIRHREITSKAVSAILLLTLKWLKVSHVMKFHHLGQLLLDTNCLLLILKMFGLQEVSVSIVSKADSPEHNFFRYCQIHFAKNSEPSPPEPQRIPRQSMPRVVTLPNGQRHEEEVDLLTEFSWRNFFSTINFAKIMQKLSKHRSHRIRMLVQYKSSAVLKRILKVQHPMLQLHVLKLLKSQVPFCGRKWRQSNMQDEWLSGIEVDDVVDAQAQEQALRHLVKFYNNKRYGASVTLQSGAHRRTASISHLEGLHPGPELSGIIRPLGTPNTSDADVFPPLRAQAPEPSIFLPYVTEDIAFEEEYEEYLSDLGWSDEQPNQGSLFGGTSAWHRLPEFASDIADGISDSESIVSIGELGDEPRLDAGREDREVPDENLNNWEHMSPKTMAALTKSPAHGRRSSSGGGLRPVLPFELDESSAIDDENDEEPELGPIPREASGPFHAGAGVDEVEYAYGV
ncbi:Striatin-interacting protein 1 [Grifola frondosa]|uniref:Striatin-interacting protein 1 n=1 Tax=Grifola frondosa TaxID=5627 RepID=A0A1C7LZP1_GRIFR|nr:Striatin-interacting protein 1 [Grifola frondosa]